jgi:CRISPR-associated endonuclease Cas1
MISVQPKLSTKVLSSDRVSEVVVVDGYGVDMRVQHGHLIINDGFASDGARRETHIPRGRSAVKRVIVRAPAGSICISALDWCNRMGVTLALVGSDSRLINCLIPDHPHDGPVKRAQAISAVTDDGVVLSRWLLAQKIESQIKAVEREFPQFKISDELDRARAVKDLRDCKTALTTEGTLVALLTREALAAQSYWRLLSGSQLSWPDWTKKRVPEHWTKIWPRGSGARAFMRDATDPFNAMLNYGYTLLEVEARIACAAHGLDPDLGLLHVDDRLRESFIYDLMEPVRSTVDVLTLRLASRGLRPWMFPELRNGVVRLEPDLAQTIARELMPQLRLPIAGVAAEYVAQLRRIVVPYRLERPTRRLAPNRPYVQERIANCEFCHQPLPKRGLKFCNRRCYLRHSIEVRQPIKLAQTRLAELRAKGLSPGHGGEAAKKRGAKIALSNRRRAHPVLKI